MSVGDAICREVNELRASPVVSPNNVWGMTNKKSTPVASSQAKKHRILCLASLIETLYIAYGSWMPDTNKAPDVRHACSSSSPHISFSFSHLPTLSLTFFPTWADPITTMHAYERSLRHAAGKVPLFYLDFLFLYVRICIAFGVFA
jgi:hypothetical protein